MSFGYSVGDAVLLVQLAWKTLQGTLKACGEHDELTREVSSLHRVLKRLQRELESPESLLNRPGDDRKQELREIGEGCSAILNVMNSILEKYNALPEEKRTGRKLWQKIRFGNGEMQDLSEIRLKLSTHTSAILMTVNLCSLGSQGRVETQLNSVGGELEGIRGKVDWIAANMAARSAERTMSVWTSYANDDKALWRELRSELNKEGYDRSVLRKHRRLIKKYVQELGERGLFDQTECDGETEEKDLPVEKSPEEQKHSPHPTDEWDEWDDFTSAKRRTKNKKDNKADDSPTQSRPYAAEELETKKGSWGPWGSSWNSGTTSTWDSNAMRTASAATTNASTDIDETPWSLSRRKAKKDDKAKDESEKHDNEEGQDQLKGDHPELSNLPQDKAMKIANQRHQSHNTSSLSQPSTPDGPTGEASTSLTSIKGQSPGSDSPDALNGPIEQSQRSIPPNQKSKPVRMEDVPDEDFVSQAPNDSIDKIHSDEDQRVDEVETNSHHRPEILASNPASGGLPQASGRKSHDESAALPPAGYSVKLIDPDQPGVFTGSAAQAAIEFAKENKENAEMGFVLPRLDQPQNERVEIIKFKDAVGRKYAFPFNKVRTWAGMKESINQAFLHIEVIGPHVLEGHYDLIGPNGEIILPQHWEDLIQPDWAVVMYMWPMAEPPKSLARPPRPRSSVPPPPPPRPSDDPSATSRTYLPQNGTLNWMASTSKQTTEPSKGVLGWMAGTKPKPKSWGKRAKKS